LPILLKFRELINNPREIYVATRGGYGHFYFLSLLFLYIGLIISFFSFKKFKLIIVFLIYLILAYLHGSKGAMIWGILSYFVFNVYYNNNLFSFKKAVFYFLSFSFLMLFVFHLTLRGVDNIKLLLVVMSKYSDYTRNAAELINNYNLYFRDYFYGVITLEDNIYSRIPRVLFPDKPRVFGTFHLPAAVFPEWFSKNIGDASFGLVGNVFADYGYFAVFYLFLLALFKGIALSWLKTNFYKSKSIFYFILMLFIAGLGFIPLGVGYLIFEHIVIALFLINMLRIRLIKKG
jgi:hypothetical protein